uniref:Putative secreted protein n=1 Tax=Panstrongylus lignarius TaxID=156445 RepID=A0A224XXU1_9HEMI
MYFPNLLELSFLVVFAFPNASKTGFDCNNLSFTVCTCPLLSDTVAIYSNTFLLASVLPEPDSPEIRMHWS